MIKFLFLTIMTFTLSTGCAQVRELEKLVKTPEQNLKMMIGAVKVYNEMLVAEVLLKKEIEAFNKEYTEADEFKKDVMVIRAQELNGRMRSLINMRLNLLHAVMVELDKIGKSLAKEESGLE